jgi:UDP-N-acetyl-D-mannosaminuronic acid dehydrogenase
VEKAVKKVVMMGLGYIGLPTAAILAFRGIEVIGVDIKEEVVKTINAGKIHIVETDLDAMVQAAVVSGRLKSSLTPENADAFLIAVPTPFQDDHKPDISAVQSAAKMIAPFLKKGDLVVLESTSPVGTTEQLSEWLAHARKDLVFPHQSEEPDVFIAYCPERVLPGKILFELKQNDRVIGGITKKCAEKAKQLYQCFVEGECILTDARTAEMCKLTENAFRDVNIAFANELSLICDKLKINVWELIRLANRHPRVKILQPGPGVGGHCIAVDPWFIVDSAPKEAQLIHTARKVNDSKPEFVIKKIKNAAKSLKHPTIACLGLSFKANIDDLRESPAMHIVERLIQERLGKILVVEPYIKTLPKRLSESVQLEKLENAIAKADIVVLLVDHQEFLRVDRHLLLKKKIIDTRGVWSGK